LEFSKLGRARFLSHLDTMRVFQRALTRADIPMMYSQGFNPHMKISIAFPLPLGAESVCEMIDLKLEYPVSGIADKLNAALPEGFQALRTLPLFNIDKITHIRYELLFVGTMAIVPPNHKPFLCCRESLVLNKEKEM
jgi:radical SAM-linked protein